MARKAMLQISCSDSLKIRVEKYQKENEISSASEAGNKLIEFALRVLDNAKEDEGPTTREILKEILRLSQYNSSTTNVVHGQTYNRDHLQNNKVEAGELRVKLKEDAEAKVELFLQGKGG